MKKMAVENPPKTWWTGSRRVEPYMREVAEAISRHLPKGEAHTDIYNRAYEAVHKALTERQSIPKERLLEWAEFTRLASESHPHKKFREGAARVIHLLKKAITSGSMEGKG